MNRQETIAILSIVRAVWPEMVVNDHVITAWMWAFEDTDYRLVEDATKRYIRAADKPFAPKPSELLKLAGVQQVAPDLIPEAAWAEVMSEVRRVGYNRPPIFHNGQFLDPPLRQFSSPLIAEAVDAIGWAEICTSDRPEIVRAQFIKALAALMERAVKRVQTGDTPSNLTAPLPASLVREIPRKAGD